MNFVIFIDSFEFKFNHKGGQTTNRYVYISNEQQKIYFIEI
jgi:hypothetical protein